MCIRDSSWEQGDPSGSVSIGQAHSPNDPGSSIANLEENYALITWTPESLAEGNEFSADTARIEVARGTLIVIASRREARDTEKNETAPAGTAE